MIVDTVSKESDLRGHPDILWYPRMDSEQNVQADWGNSIGSYGGHICINPQFVEWPEYRITVLRMETDGLDNPFTPQWMGPTILGSSWRLYLNHATRQQSVAKGLGTVSVRDLYSRYLVKIDPDVAVGLNELGVKLPGFEGSGGLSTRMEHGRVIAGTNPPEFPFLTYWYLSDPTLKDPSGYGLVKNLGRNFVAGKVHCIEQHLRLNTPTSDPLNPWNSDGVLEAWFDGELVFSRNDVLIQRSAWPCEINNFFGNFYHGGRNTPKSRMHYEFGGIALAHKRIGPPKMLTQEEQVMAQLRFSVPAAGEYDLVPDASGSVVVDAVGSYRVDSYTPPAPNDPPTCSLAVSPSSVVVPSSVQLMASANDSDGTVARVEFFENDVLVDTITAPPYTSTRQITVAGQYEYTAKAFDNSGDSHESSAIQVVASTASGLPSWVPAIGTRSNVSLNLMKDVDPCPARNCAYSGVGGLYGVFAWSGMTYASGLGALGSLLMCGGGHTDYYGNEVYRYDIATQTWSRLCDPFSGPFFSDGGGSGWYGSGWGGPTNTNDNGEYWTDSTCTDTRSDQPVSSHHYDAIGYLPPGVGGSGSNGALLTGHRRAVPPPGSKTGLRAHAFDLVSNAWGRFSTNNIKKTGSFGNLSVVGGSLCVAPSKGKAYLTCATNTSAPLNVLDLTTRAWSELLLINSPGFFEGNLRYIEALDLLLWYVSGPTSHGMRVINPNTGQVYNPGMTGKSVFGYGGGEWVEELGAFYYYHVGGGDTVWSLRPSSNPTTQPWVWTSEQVSGVPAIPSSSSMAHYSRFKWVPSCRVFLWLAGAGSPVQAFRVQGT